MKKFLLIGFFLVVGLSSQAKNNQEQLVRQIDSLQQLLLNVPAMKYDSLFSQVLPWWSQQTDSTFHEQLVSTLATQARTASGERNQSTLLYATGWFYRHLVANYARSLHFYQLAFDKAEVAQDRVLMANAMLRSMETFIELGSFEEALQYLFKAEAVFQKYNYEGFKSVTNSLFGIGQFFHRAGYYELSVQYFERALVFNDLHDDDYSLMHAYNTLGLSYLRMKNFQKAVEVFQISNQMAREMGDTGWEALTYGNIGMVYYEQKDYPRAEEHLQYDIETSARVEGWASACNAAVLMAEMYLEMRNPDKAGKFIELAKNYEQLAPALYLKHYIADLIDDYYLQKKQYQLAFEAKLVLDSLSGQVEEIEEQQRSMQAQKRHAYELQQAALEAEIALEVSKADASKWQQLGMLVSVVLLLLAVAAWSLLRRARKANALVLEEMQLQMQRKELAQLRKLLNYYVNQLQERKGNPIPEPEGWKEQLRELMNRCYNQFFVRHKTSFPELVDNDIVLMALAKLKFSEAEITELAGQMGIDFSVWQTQLAKKLGGLPEEKLWDELLQM